MFDIAGRLRRGCGGGGAMQGPGVLQLTLWRSRLPLPVFDLPGGGVGEPDGGGDGPGHQVSPHHHKLLPGLSRPRRPHHSSILSAAGL